jgi:predicted alpha/beta-fold hydrolase
MIARGMMDTEMVGWNAFHGARTGDVDIAARKLRRGVRSLAQAYKKQRSQVLTGVGYSMGAIILSNYVARSGDHCALDAAMAVSGGLDMRQQLNFRRSMRLWQPMLTFNLREDILIGKYARHYKSRLTEGQFLRLLRVTSISALDVEAIVTYNSFSDLVHYYTEMSAMGDRDPEFQLFSGTDADSPVNDPSWGRIANVSVPFAVLQALDDPLVGWRTIGTEHPQGLVDSGNGNVMLLLTKAGGHVGWPLGSNPKKHAWKWMSNAVRDFALAVNMARKELNE